MEYFKNLISIDTIIVLILGVALFNINPDLQAQIVAGYIGYLGGKGVGNIK